MHKTAPFALLLVLLAGCAATPYEQPKYDVVRTTPAFEVRRYAPYAVAETTVAGEFDAARNMAFRRLFAYITGSNRAKQKIDMTVPVVTESASQKIEMTVPVVTAAGEQGATVMQFMLPSRFTPATAPEPTDTTVRIREIGEQWLAVRTFSGTTGESNFRENEAALRAALQEAGLTGTGDARFAVYNGPFTLWFLRQNEVRIPVAPVR